MKAVVRMLGIMAFILFVGVPLCSAGLIYQDFEDNNGSDFYGWGYNQTTVERTGLPDPVHSGTDAWKITITGTMGGTGIQSQVQTWDMDFEPERHDRLTFWIHANPDPTSENMDNDVFVKFFDNSNYKANAFGVWTSKAAKFGEWTRLSVLFTQLPEDFNLASIDKIEIVNYNPVVYYLDDIQIVSEDRVYQSFEPIIFEPNFTGEEYEKYGWAWNGTVDLYVDEQIVQEGVQSWQIDTIDLLGGTGIKSQEKKLVEENQVYIQSPWHVDLTGTTAPGAPINSLHDRLTFWFYSLPENGMDNNLNIQFFYNSVDENDQKIIKETHLWTDQPSVYGQWTKFTLPFDEIPPDVTLDDLNKLQFQVFWRGRYFIDDIRAAKPLPIVDKSLLRNGIVQWNAIDEADFYIVEESQGGPNGPWESIYQGTNNSISLERVSPIWIRVRWEENIDPISNPIPYVSDYSDIVYYTPAPVLIKFSALSQGNLEWTNLPQADTYEVEEAANKNGPWSLVYSGVHTALASTNGMWYRVRALTEENGLTTDTSEWSPTQSYTPGAGYLKAVGQSIKELDGNGDKIILSGVNLGNLFLLEPWMTGMDVGDPDKAQDDWNVRETLIERFGVNEARRLLDVYRDTYIQEADLDNILSSGANLIRLPIYYRVIREIDESTGEWVAGSDYDFSKIDQIVNWCADRGIYVLLDLHGAPGHQSKEFHSGRESADIPSEGYYHQLFDPNDNTYRLRTIELWEAMADHYKENTTVMGYDLLNEPFGVTDTHYYPQRTDGYSALWSLYDQLYDAIRLKDPHHIIVMEAVPSDKDWETLPKPSDYSWDNVVYQFHYYGFKFDEHGEIDGILDIVNQKKYLVNGDDPDCELFADDDKFCGKVLYSKQDEYNVPVLIGEFNGFNQREIWDLFVQTFNQQDWSWTMWSYKHHPAREEWGLYTHLYYDDEVPNISVDSGPTLETKFSKYDTHVHHGPNVTLNRLLNDYMEQSKVISQPAVAGRTSDEVTNKWHKVLFSDRFSKKPVLIAGIESYDGPNTAGLRIKRLNRRGFRVKIEEERSNDPETFHTTEVVSYFALQPGAITNEVGQIIGEAGHVSAYQRNGSQWHTIQLKHDYVNPVVFMQIVTYHGRQPAHIRLKNIDGESFEYQIEEWDYLNQRHLIEKISYVVVEAGVHTLTDGKDIEVGLVNIDHNWLRVLYTNSYSTAPVTISQCQTYIEGGAVITRQRDVQANGFDIMLQEEEGSDGLHVPESVGYIAIDTDY